MLVEAQPALRGMRGSRAMSSHACAGQEEGYPGPPAHGGEDANADRSYRKNEPIGDKLEKKEGNATRMYFKNANGFKLQRDGGELLAARTAVAKGGIGA